MVKSVILVAITYSKMRILQQNRGVKQFAPLPGREAVTSNSQRVIAFPREMTHASKI
jgi:hypothetical protein